MYLCELQIHYQSLQYSPPNHCASSVYLSLPGFQLLVVNAVISKPLIIRYTYMLCSAVRLFPSVKRDGYWR